MKTDFRFPKHICSSFKMNAILFFTGPVILSIVFLMLGTLFNRINGVILNANEVNLHMRRRLAEMELEIDMMRAEVWRSDKSIEKFVKTFA